VQDTGIWIWMSCYIATLFCFRGSVARFSYCTGETHRWIEKAKGAAECEKHEGGSFSF
jgi:hypothetical protein